MMSAHDTVVMMLDIITDVNNRFHVKLTPGLLLVHNNTAANGWRHHEG